MGTSKLKTQEIKLWRERFVKKQGYICPLCKEHLKVEDAVLDHCHDTGHIRCALHRSCNSAEGRVKEWAGKRSRGTDPDLWLRNLLRYWKRDFTKNPIHPTHGRKRRRKRRVRTKKTNCVH